MGLRFTANIALRRFSRGQTSFSGFFAAPLALSNTASPQATMPAIAFQSYGPASLAFPWLERSRTTCASSFRSAGSGFAARWGRARDILQKATHRSWRHANRSEFLEYLRSFGSSSIARARLNYHDS